MWQMLVCECGCERANLNAADASIKDLAAAQYVGVRRATVNGGVSSSRPPLVVCNPQG